MKKNLWICLLALLMVACDTIDGTEPIVSKSYIERKDYINVISSMSLLGDGETKEMTISSNCNWTITSSDAWLTVTPSSGNGEGVVTVSAGKNSTGNERTATLTVQGGNAPTKTVMVTQAKGTDDTPVDDTQEPGKDDNLPPE